MNSTALVLETAPANTNAPAVASVVTFDGVTKYRNLKNRDWTRGGRKHEGSINEGQHADVIPGKSIVLHGVYMNRVGGPVAYRREFKIGDVAEFDSYNLSFYGKILAIGEKTITIDSDGLRSRAQRLDICEFSSRNWDFDQAQKSAENSATMAYI